MSATVRSTLTAVVVLAVLAGAIALVVLGHAADGWGALGTMLAGLALLLVLLAGYNRSRR
ncbi:hypothetical protein [Rathayibacter sp. VKM Ac-2760]|uniref:DUF6903 family protein n=1 Tax=Rathayibacter sp. VKM Ac-2760 TaxID=2609253 RepID=UPI00131718EC|nr:hypothetical protein [Rathayibacter sp. VKM Ac-2760]QHC61036.1 hypothetical protein GSU72_20125 [Rathayibacter sp. VKM Ac-2760]